MRSEKTRRLPQYGRVHRCPRRPQAFVCRRGPFLSTYRSQRDFSSRDCWSRWSHWHSSTLSSPPVRLPEQRHCSAPTATLTPTVTPQTRPSRRKTVPSLPDGMNVRARRSFAPRQSLSTTQMLFRVKINCSLVEAYLMVCAAYMSACKSNVSGRVRLADNDRWRNCSPRSQKAREAEACKMSQPSK